MSYFFDLLDWRCCLPEPSDTFPCRFPADCSRVVTPDASAIPAMQRRRLSRLARASVSAMSPLVERYGNMPVVFCSRHGEMDRTLGLLRSLAQAEPLSPMSFSLSVHNAIVGQHSILSGNHHNVTAISGGTDELLPTLIEGCGQLESGVPQVMLVFADAPLPEPFVDYCSHPSDLYACAMVMSKGTTMSVAACGDILRQCPHPELPQSLALLHALALGAQPLARKGSAVGRKLNYVWRLFATAASFLLFGIGGMLIPLLATPLIQLTSKTESERRWKARKLIQYTFLGFTHFMRMMGVLTWDVRNLERLQRRRLLVLANHPTLIDVVFLVAFIPHADCVVKGRLRRNFCMRGFINLTGYIGNDEGADLVESAKASLSAGSALILFPEGTRTTPGRDLAFKRGAANVSLRAQVDPTPVVIHCHPITLTKQNKWYHIPPERFHLQFDVQDDIDTSSYEALPPTVAARRLTKDLEHYFEQQVTHIHAQ